MGDKSARLNRRGEGGGEVKGERDSGIEARRGRDGRTRARYRVAVGKERERREGGGRKGGGRVRLSVGTDTAL